MRELWARRAAAVFILSAGIFTSPLILSSSQQMDRRRLLLTFPLWQALPLEISGWKTGREDQVFDRENIFDYMDGGGEVYLAFDFRFVFVREYVKTEAPSIVVEIYQMSSSEDAFGVFTQDTDGDEVKTGQNGIYAGGLLRFWKNDIFVRILTDQETPEAKSAVIRLGELIEASITQEGKRPQLISVLPTEGLKPKSLRYFHTLISLNAHFYLANVNILNLSPETQAVLARYEKDGAQARLLLVGYPSSERAFDAYGRFVEMFLLERFGPDARVRPKKLENGKFAGIDRKGEYLIITLDADKKSLLEWLVKQVSVNL